MIMKGLDMKFQQLVERILSIKQGSKRLKKFQKGIESKSSGGTSLRVKDNIALRGKRNLIIIAGWGNYLHIREQSFVILNLEERRIVLVAKGAVVHK